MTRQERFYLCAFVVTNVGVGGFALAMGLAMYEATGSATAFGAMVGLESLIGIGGQFLGGSFLDRRNVLRIALAGNSTRGAAIALGAVLALLSHSVVPLLAAFAVSSVIRPLYRSASFALVPRVTTRERLPRVNGLRFGLLQAAQIAGLLLVSALSTFVHPDAILVVLGGIFLLATLSLVPLVAELERFEPEVSAGERPSLLLSWRQLAGVFRRAPVGLVHLVLGAFAPMLVLLTDVMIVPIDKQLHGGGAGLAVINTALMLGALVTTLTYVRRTGADALPRNVAVALGAAPLVLLFLAVAPGIPGAALTYLLLGVVVALAAASLDSLLQLRAGPGFVGRLGVSQEIVTSVLAVALLPLSGPALTHLGYHGAAVVFAAGAALFPALLLVGALRWRGALFTAPLAVAPAPSEAGLGPVRVEGSV
jgi:MFS family permease